MAATAITKTDLKLNTFKVMPTTAAVDTTDGALVAYDKADHKILLIVENANATTAYDVTIKKGDGIQGVSDLVFEVPKASTYCIVIESAKYVNMSGANQGKVVITGEAVDIKVSAVVLP